MESLKAIGKSYTTETLKAAIAQSTLDKEQIKVILSANGLQGELLETTADELANAASTNMVAASQVGTTTTTIGLGTAFKGLGIKIKEATVSLWTFLTTTPAGWATLIIGALAGAAFGIKKYNDYLEESKQKIRETADEAKSAVDNIKSDFNKLSSATGDIKKRYAELAQEVENLGKVNQSRGNLNNEEYAEFLNLSNQLAELFPQLTVNYDDNGNAILGLSGNVDTIVGSLNNLVDVQQKLASQEILENMPDIWSGYMLDAEEFNKKLKTSEETVENYLKWANDLRNRSVLSLSNENDNDLLVKAAIEAGIMNSRYGNDFYNEKNVASDAGTSFISASWDFTKLSENEFDKLLNKLEEFGSEYEDTVQIVKGNIASANSGMAGYINTWLSTEWNYSKMDSNMQNVIKSMLQGGDWVDLIPDNVDASKWNEVSNWLQDEFLYEINKVQNNEKISKALSEVFTNQDLTPKEKADYIKQIQEYFGENHAITLSLKPQLEESEDIEAQYQRAIDFAKNKFKDYDPTTFFKEHSINTQEEIDIWQKIVESVNDAVEAEKKYLGHKREEHVSLSISETIDQLNTQLKPAFDSLQSAYQDIFSDDSKFKLNSIDILSTCDSIKSKLDELNKIDGISVDYSAFEDFVRVLNNTESTENDVEKAFDSLATSITHATLSGTEDFETMKAALEDLGVVNSEMVAFGALVSNAEMLEEALSQANASMDDFIVNTEDGSVKATEAGRAFLEEKVGAENCAEALKILAFHKELCNLQEMNTAVEVANLKTLAENAGYTGEVIQYLTELEQIYQEVASGTLTKEQILAKTGRATLLKALIDSAASNINYAPEVDFSGAVKDAKSAGGKAGDAYVEEFEKSLKELETLRDQGKITEKEYLDQLRVNINALYHSNMICKK